MPSPVPPGASHERRAVRVRVGHVHEPGHQRAIPERQVARLRTDRAGGPRLAVVAAHEPDHDRAAGRATHEPHRGLDGLRAVQGDVDTAERPGRDGHETLSQGQHVLVRVVVRVLVAVATQRVDRCVRDVSASGPRGHRGHRADEVEVDVAVDVLDLMTRLAADDERSHLVGQPAVQDRGLALEDGTRLRTWRRGDDLRHRAVRPIVVAHRPRLAQSPVMAHVMPGTWMLTNNHWPSGEKVGPANSEKPVPSPAEGPSSGTVGS